VGRLKELLGVIGGSAGVLYATGYLVLAGHSRVLGLQLRSTDTATLLLNAWEFFVQGTLYAVLRILQAISTSLWSLFLPRIIVVGVVLWRRGVDPVAAWVNRARTVGLRHDKPLNTIILLTVIAAQTYDLAAHVVPSASVTSLLAAPEPVISPFPPLRPAALRRFFERHWNDVRQSIVGDGMRSDARTLSGLYVTHLLITAATASASLWLWFLIRRQKRHNWMRPIVTVALTFSALLLLYTPLYYGVTMKSYRYSRVKLTPAESKQAEDIIAAEFMETTLRPRFLVQVSDSDYVLYESRTREIHFVRRDLVGIMKVMTDDFIFTDAAH